MTDFHLYYRIVEESISKEIAAAQKKYGHCIVLTGDGLAQVSNWLNGKLIYWEDYEYLIDYESNHYIFFLKESDLTWFMLSNNLTNFTIRI